ncbi:mannose-1-phosphate guanylyltransferase/mannose-6-phosphate isomerase [Mesorhizobium sp. DCY119]|jgi:mannose-1-phosphate guanylyltransferase|uniref:mannose-1-phosphate guanylyltransferase/mannose-6-phosphate isomerase n=1 Tax=Mesorhizobium sp. DCY119 TaxID=2108445 RepID=UPI000E6CD945|nr:mannose-1-phosphate guanylyltransferase/mannose-6-phosphate isomerase [Mesorhizobium sp. DCY119]RJG46610.1 mannose-1-phosphate guanylyltransferase/mannose-6-phosphate isomerase [Mesorhizobium sp. DCY119]
MFLPVIMAGGSGSRLWPLSRHLYPKQFLALTGERTLLQDTVIRLEGLGAESPLLICNEEHRFLAADQMRVIDKEQATILLEPVGRNTAPAIALAALLATRQGQDPLLLVLAADHFIQDVARFQDAIRAAVPLAEQGKLVTFGIVPSRPETGYGYIKRGGEIGAGFAVSRFEEKPDRETAEGYLATGEYYWNSGIFMFRASRYLEELKRHNPEMVAACDRAISNTQTDMHFVRIDAEAFKACPADSIDYAVMEKTSDAVVVPLDARWSDIGSWSALWEVQAQNAEGNAFRGDVISIGSTNNLVHAEGRLVAVIGVEDLIVVETKDAVLIAHKDQVQKVKDVVEQIKSDGRHEHLNHRQVYRPWGHYDSIDFGERDQVKRITVKPGAKLSVQMHHHRAEHWIVVRGTAKVHKGKETILLTENQSTYIPLGEIHALENPGKIDLELIEVQSGSYLGEDDIVRFEDRYGRS